MLEVLWRLLIPDRALALWNEGPVCSCGRSMTCIGMSSDGGTMWACMVASVRHRSY